MLDLGTENTLSPYELARNSLIPLAVGYADAVTPYKSGDPRYVDEWNRIYHRTMDKLWKERGKNLLRHQRLTER